MAVFKSDKSTCMFTTIALSPKTYVPVESRPKEYRFRGSSPRARRFVAHIRQLVKEHGNKTERDATPL
jgi:hypothetical protein